MILEKEFRFEASHQLQFDPGKCSRLHGHSWKLKVMVKGARNEYGIVVNYRDIKERLAPLIDSLDHWHLGYIFSTRGVHESLSPLVVKWLSSSEYTGGGFEPTSENLLWLIAWWIETNCPQLPWFALELSETCTCSAMLLHSEFSESQVRKEAYEDARQAIQQEGKGSNE